ncbi:hypothetical protein [Bacillus thuringiensis]|nr:hypothetical protein [Bacillus thuringiensis]
MMTFKIIAFVIVVSIVLFSVTPKLLKDKKQDVLDLLLVGVGATFIILG